MSVQADRRAVLRMIAAGAVAAASGCSQPDDQIFPYVNQPEGMAQGTIRRYATGLPLAGYMRGLVGLVTDGRPIKIEGLPGHPASMGATDLFAECAILDLFDPQRIAAPRGPQGPASWTAMGEAAHARLARTGGKGLRVLTGRITSPTMLNRIEGLLTRYPAARHVRWEPLGDDAQRTGTTHAFGRTLTPRPRWSEADVILMLGADPLGPGPEQIANARHWSANRSGGRAQRLFALEPSLTATGAMADRRASVDAHVLARAAHALAALWNGEAPPVLPAEVDRLIREAASALAAAPGRGLVVAGDSAAADIHAFAAWANARIQARVDWIMPVDPVATDHETAIGALAAEMHEGRVDTLVMIDSNPVYAAPPDLHFARALDSVPLIVAASSFPNESMDAAHWALPLSHGLEGWHDGRAPDGTATIAQPLIRPLYDTRTPVELIDLLIDPNGGPGSRARVREQWAGLDDAAWRGSVAAAMVAGSAAPFVTPPAPAMILPAIPPAGLMIEVRPSPILWDGAMSHNAWAQECPDPITKEVWGASARLDAATMQRLDMEDGDQVTILRGRHSLTLPVLGAPGQAAGTITLMPGYGRTNAGAVADDIGANAFALSGSGAISIARASGQTRIASTQHMFALEGELERLFPTLKPGSSLSASASPHQPSAPQPSLVGRTQLAGAKGPQWAMAIDTHLCIGCNACVVACQAENNIPAIGPEEMARGRDMHWLRIDRYDIGEQGQSGFQPVPCMHCEKAPCEPVCPVEASVHDHQGLNVQVYNRCIGTRTCQANCPYKVRRFNFFDYAKQSLWGDADMASVTAQRNPDVTVRSRGVMEKCTYCVQRISAANRSAAAEGKAVGEVVTACQSACPTRAINFGDLTDPASSVSRARASDRHYALLDELGTRPRTTYLARVVQKAHKP